MWVIDSSSAGYDSGSVVEGSVNRQMHVLGESWPKLWMCGRSPSGQLIGITLAA